MAHYVHAVHTGDHGLSGTSPSHTETRHYHVHHSGVELGTDSSGKSSDKHIYNVVHKGTGVVHKFHVQASSKNPGSHHVTHMGAF